MTPLNSKKLQKMAWLSTTQVRNAKICEFIPKSKRFIV